MKFIFETFNFDDILSDASQTLQEISKRSIYSVASFKYVRMIFSHSLTIKSEFNVQEKISE